MRKNKITFAKKFERKKRLITGKRKNKQKLERKIEMETNSDGEGVEREGKRGRKTEKKGADRKK